MKNDSRRTFLKTFALAVAAVAAAPVMKIQEAFAAAVNPADPLVKALGYVPNAKDAKDRKDKNAHCGNCNFYQGDAKSKEGKCQLIASGDVASAGWCRSWAAKQKK